MENLLEIIIPLVFAAIYFFGNMFAKKDDVEGPGAPAHRRERPQTDDAEAEERQRKIQEEIRRKIMERRGAASNRSESETAAESSGPRPEELRKRREAVESRRQMREQQKEVRERVHQSETAEATAEVPATKKPVEQSEVGGGFSWDDSGNIYSDGIDDRLKEIEATQRQAAALKKKAVTRMDAAGASRNATRRRRGSRFSGSVRQSLTDPAAARVAFVYGEVLSRPIGLRKGESNVPGLSS